MALSATTSVSMYLFVLSLCVINTAASAALDKEKRELPLSFSCDPSITGSCYKGDLVSESVSDCERDASFFNVFTCDPINDYSLSSVVDVPDVSARGVDCVPTHGLPIRCGSPGTDTRCVCDQAYDIERLQFNECRCQYWPAVDVRMNRPSYCTQWDHGGTSGIHFYGCCNNCNDNDPSCDGQTYQGGGSTEAYCGQCGQNSPLGRGRITYRYNCVSCAQQNECERKCDDLWFGLTENLPSLCPKWLGCFRGCCLKAEEVNSRRKRGTNQTVEISTFCGDYVCQNGEDTTICPVDCCPQVNSECDEPCAPDCCLEPECCIFTSHNSDTSPGAAVSTSTVDPFMCMSMVYTVYIIVSILSTTSFSS